MKEFNIIAVYDLLFYRVDENGNPLTDKNGKAKMYRADIDCQYLSDGLDIEDLKAVTNE